jgi:hypothetical protein
MATTPSINSMPKPAPLWLTVCTKAFSIGDSLAQIQQAKKALAAPAMKLFICGRRDGRYRNPEPDECGGMMKMS